MAKNLLLTGNPVYPYLSRVFPSALWDAAAAGRLQTLVAGGGTWPIGQYLRFCLEMFTRPYRYGVIDALGVLPLLGLPFLLAGFRDRETALLARAGLFSFLLLLLFGRVPRYFVPALLLLCVPMAAGFEAVLQRRRLLRRLAWSLFFLAALSGLREQVRLQERFSRGWATVRRALFAAPGQPRLPYLRHLPYYPAARFINESLPAGSRIALIGEERTFYLVRPFLAASFVDRNPALEIVAADAGRGGKIARLRELPVTHLLVCGGEIGDIYRPPAFPDGLEAGQRERARLFLRTLPLLYRDRAYYVVKVE